MLYGVRRDLQERLRKEGYNVRAYIPFGTQMVSLPHAPAGGASGQHPFWACLVTWVCVCVFFFF